MRASKRDKDRIRTYVEHQAHETVVHLEKAATELVGPVRHDVWDVHCSESRWWVITEPTNLYSQTDFKSRDVALTFHIGLTLRMSYLQERDLPVSPDAADLPPGSWRRWEQAFEAYQNDDEAETFQAVGMRLRECLLSFIGETCSDELTPPGKERPKNGDFRGWSDLLVDSLAPGGSSTKLRSYLKKLATETWEYTNWLTHAKNARRLDAEIGLKAVEHLLGTFTAARLRLGQTVQRCGVCSSYKVMAGVCNHCGWTDTAYEEPTARESTEEEPTLRLNEPCIPSSDISTFMTPDDFS